MPRVTANTATFSAPLETIARASKSAGFDGLEIWARDVEKLDGRCERVGDILREHGLALSALQVLRDFEGCPEADRPRRLEEAEGLLDLASRLGVDTLLLCANADADSSGDSTDQVRDLRGLADMAAARRLRIAFEPLAWSRWIDRYELALPCIEAVDHPAMGIGLDCFHLFHQASPIELLDRLPAEKCFLVQLCDGVPMDLPAIQIARHHRLFPGEGAWPVAELVRRIEAKGYDGFYNIEVINDRYRALDPDMIARRAFAAFLAVSDPRAWRDHGRE